MIVNQSENHFEIIYQRAHAMLAARIAGHVHPDLRPPPQLWIETLIAIADHDDGNTRTGGTYYINEDGEPKDFREFEFEYEAVQEIILNAELKSRWSSFLVAKHTEHLYCDLDNEQAREVVSQQINLQESLLPELRIDRATADRAYQLVKWCDELSLMLCMKKIPEEGGSRTIEELPGGLDSKLINQNGLSVRPWCFKADELGLEVEYRCIPKRPYQDDRDLKKTLKAAEIQVRKWKLEMKH